MNMKITRMISVPLAVLLSSLAVSCNKMPERQVETMDFDQTVMAGEIGRSFSNFVSEYEKYTFASNVSDGVIVLDGKTEIDGQQVDLNVFVTSDYDGNVTKILAQPVKNDEYGMKMWKYFTSGDGMATLGTFDCAKFRKDDEVGVLGSIAELDKKVEDEGTYGLFVCAVFDYNRDVIMAPVYEDNASGLLISASRTTVHYDKASDILNITYESARNNNFILSTVVSEEKLKSTTLDDAVDIQGTPVNFTIYGDQDSDYVKNINVTSVNAVSPADMQEFWKTYVQDASELGLGKFSSAEFAMDDEDAEGEEFKTAQLAVDYLEENGMPAAGQTLTVSFVSSDIYCSVCIDDESAWLDIRKSAFNPE